MLPTKLLKLICFFLFAFMAIAMLGSTTHAQNKEKGPAFTSPPAKDMSYPLMGEFIGAVTSDDGKKEIVGLQIRAIGNDQFDAIAYYGGLPGQPKFRPQPIHLIGKRSGKFVILSGGPWAIFVENNQCRLVDLKGKPRGQLKRVKRKSPTMYSPAPEGAVVLFDGTGTDQFTTAEMTGDGLLMEGADVKPMFQDFNLHAEFRLPYMPIADGQQRGNSGLYLQSRYECQVLDSFALLPKIDGLGALYRFRPPAINMCFPPLVWQTYDVQFTAPRWNSDGTKARNATITSWVNGVKVQDGISLPNKTGAGKLEAPLLLPTRLQNHGDPVRFRNIWVVDRGLATSEFPQRPTREQIQSAIKSDQLKRKERAKEARRNALEKKRAAAKEKSQTEQLKAQEGGSPQTPAESAKQKPAKQKPAKQ
ncbi:MAG: DUF1080 domain-containing protein, partial [Mariniblastus sp.]|nr:DUF1080 domain-containing protein [Mariniblastus sp.]